MSLTKDQILKSDDLPREEVEVPEWGGSVWVRSMSGTERDAFETSMMEEKNGKSKATNLRNIRARMAVLCCTDDKGERLFTHKDEGSVGMKSAAALDRIFTVAQKLNGMSNEDVEELAGNSEGELTVVSTSG